MQLVNQVGIERTPCVDSDRTFDGARRIASVLKCLPRTFEKQSMLRVNQLSFTATVAKELRVEVFDVRQYGACAHIMRLTCIRIIPRRAVADTHFDCRFHTLLQIAPQSSRLVRSRKPEPNSDDRHIECEMLHSTHLTSGSHHLR